MHTLTLRRLSGYALVLAAFGCIAGGLMHPVVDGHAHSAQALLSPHELTGTLTLLTGTVLLLLGLPGVYGWAADRLGVLGFAGFAMTFLGNLLSAVPHLVVMGFIGPEVARRAPALVSPGDMIIDSRPFAIEQVATGMLLIAGLLVLGIALLRSPLPRWLGILAVAGAVLLVTPLPALPMVGGLQIELARGVVVAGLGVLAVRSTRVSSADQSLPQLTA